MKPADALRRGLHSRLAWLFLALALAGLGATFVVGLDLYAATTEPMDFNNR